MNRLLLTLALAILPATLPAQTSYLLKPFEQQAGEVMVIRSSSVSSKGKMVIERGGEKTEGALSMLRGEVGGFDLGSDLTWQVMGGVGYRVGESSDVFFGYRHLKIDYSENNFTYDTETSSFILGMNFFF